MIGYHRNTAQVLRLHGVRQQDIADACGISQTLVSLQLAGKRLLSPDVARAASELSGLSIPDLFPQGAFRMADSDSRPLSRTALIRASRRARLSSRTSSLAAANQLERHGAVVREGPDNR
jgi:transcriptional regulator with XRE-family HTH domain